MSVVIDLSPSFFPIRVPATVPTYPGLDGICQTVRSGDVRLAKRWFPSLTAITLFSRENYGTIDSRAHFYEFIKTIVRSVERFHQEEEEETERELVELFVMSLEMANKTLIDLTWILGDFFEIESRYELPVFGFLRMHEGIDLFSTMRKACSQGNLELLKNLYSIRVDRPKESLGWEISGCFADTIAKKRVHLYSFVTSLMEKHCPGGISRDRVGSLPFGTWENYQEWRRFCLTP